MIYPLRRQSKTRQRHQTSSFCHQTLGLELDPDIAAYFIMALMLLTIIIARVLYFSNSRQTSHGALLSSYHRTSLIAPKTRSTRSTPTKN